MPPRNGQKPVVTTAHTAAQLGSVQDPKPLPIYIGIDPGKHGGIAVLWEAHGTEPIRAQKMPETDMDICSLFRRLSGCHGPASTWESRRVFAVIEQVQGYIGSGEDGEGKHPGSRMFKFGMNYGALKMALCAASIPYETVTPQKWQRALGIPPRKAKAGETKSQFKTRLKAKAQALFPGVKVTKDVADALLIAEYGKRLKEGLL